MAPAIKNKFFNRLTILSVFFAFIVWGGWAFWINLSGGDTAQAVRSGLTQGIYSGVMTLYMSYAVSFFCKKTQGRRLWWLWPTLVTVGPLSVLSVIAHILNHTPNVAKTVAVPLLVATLYCLWLTRNFHKNSV
jgi:hypothetical protein